MRRSASWASPAPARASPTSPSSACSTRALEDHGRDPPARQGPAQGARPVLLRDVRGKDVAMIFQGPVRVPAPHVPRRQPDRRGGAAHSKVSKRQAIERAVEVLDAVGIRMPARGQRTFRTSFRRHAPARDDREELVRVVLRPLAALGCPSASTLDRTLECPALRHVDVARAASAIWSPSAAWGAAAKDMEDHRDVLAAHVASADGLAAGALHARGSRL